MKLAIAFLLLVLAAPHWAAAASKTITTTTTSTLKVEGEENGPIPNKVMNDYYDNCKFHIPDRFTPKARTYYCACNSAAVQGNFLMKDFLALQKSSNQKPGNKLFEKYIQTAVAPCLDMPVPQIEYLTCVLENSSDIRIRYVPGYCKCVGFKIGDHSKRYADTEIMTRLGEDPGAYKDPVDALWDNPSYITARTKAYDDCLRNPNYNWRP